MSRNPIIHIILVLDYDARVKFHSRHKEARQGETCNKREGDDGRYTLRRPMKGVVILSTHSLME
jgi:hypothetical protein